MTDTNERQPLRAAGAELNSGLSAFGVVFWGLLVVAAGLIGAHLAGVIDLSPVAERVAAMIADARAM